MLKRRLIQQLPCKPMRMPSFLGLPACLSQAGGRLVFCIAAALLAGPAHALITLLPTGSPRSITMRVGSAIANDINTVTFDVQNANVSPNPTAVTGVPSAGSSSTAGRVTILVQTKNGNNTPLRVTANSAAGLTCVSGSGCGTTIIPFSTISWTSYNKDTTYPTLDFQSGTFTGGATQQLISVTLVNVSVIIANELVFSYSNTTLYPAGQYRGRVAYTATMP